ncbi:hypothetical protein Pcinc_025663 [Petrolisthes cinctipes]|uniref:Uncharacterized protein n=1 Tax=Petrolisthes cinctipes TaxID=88211 RepID=A0AAE1KBK5_PETCI|nr:hypothetical protein Pcinc_025663 [Petrolisthes cinctipes]
MIMGPRPSIGWLGYLVIGGSVRRLGYLLLIAALGTLVIVHQAKDTITLTFSLPLPFPPPMLVVPPPGSTHLTALDACSVEAAGLKPHQMDSDQIHEGSMGVKKQMGREVHVYGWSVSVDSTDMWAQWVAHMSGVHMSLLHLPKVVTRTPIKSLASVGGEEWRVWAAARVGLLWGAGGVSVPMGVVARKPLWVEVVGSGSGLLVGGRDGRQLDPTLMATPAHHPLLKTLAKHLIEDRSLTNLTQLLTKAAREQCEGMTDSDQTDFYCDDFTILLPSAVLDISLEKIPTESEVESAVVLRYTGPREDLLHLPTARRLFRHNKLHLYCPRTAQRLKQTTSVSL